MIAGFGFWTSAGVGLGPGLVQATPKEKTVGARVTALSVNSQLPRHQFPTSRLDCCRCCRCRFGSCGVGRWELRGEPAVARKDDGLRAAPDAELVEHVRDVIA